MTIISKILKYIVYTLFIPFWWLQLIIPRKRGWWVFGAWFGEKYSDNAKILYEYVLENYPEITPVWLTGNREIYNRLKDENRKTAMISSFKGIYYSLLAGKVIYSSGKSDINRFCINGAKIIHVWHGAPIKKIGLDDNLVNNPLRTKIWKYIYPFIYGYNQHAIVSTAEVFNDILCSAFDAREDQILLTGYPRNDVFFSAYTHPLIEEWDTNFNRPTKIIYLPTFRGSNTSFEPFKDYNFNYSDWEKYLEETNSLLITKGHFVDEILEDRYHIERIIHLSDKSVGDLNPLLTGIDILITDYSSVYFDFLLAQRPIILSPFDFENYITRSRELYFDYFNDIVGQKGKDWAEILSILESGSYKSIDFQRVRHFNTFWDGMSCERLYTAIGRL